MTDYYALLDAVEKYYGSGSDQWAEIAKYGIASDKAESILSQVPGVNIVKNANGSIRSYNLLTSQNVTPSAEIAVNSNVPAVVKSVDIPANTALTTVTTPAGETVKQMTFKSGMKQAGNFVFGEVLPAVAAVGTGITLGKTIDKLLYNANPDFWDEHGMSTLNPDVWGDIIGKDSAGGRVLNVILGTTQDNKAQAYIDEKALAYMALYMQNEGVFNTGTVDYSSKEITVDNVDIPAGLNRIDSKVREIEYDGYTSYVGGTIGDTAISNMYPLVEYDSEYLGNELRTTLVESSDNVKFIITSSANTNIAGYTIRNKGTNAHISTVSVEADSYTFNNKTVQYGYVYNQPPFTNINTVLPYVHVNISASDLVNDVSKRIAWLLFNGEWNVTESPTIDGIGTQDNAKTPDLSNAGTVEDVLNALKSQYPELFNNAVTQDVVQPDGSTKTYTYVPVAMPALDQEGNPISSTATQALPQIDPATATAPLLDVITKLLQKDNPVNPPATGEGETPVVPQVTGKASALYSIYNPTLAQVNSLGAWLWSSNFIDQLLKLFSSPMDAIIGLHKIYATPATGAEQNIKVGYLDSGVSSKVVTEQYTTIDCGTVNCYEYFGNVLDYNPYTNLRLYLPFIGIIDLSNSDVMRSSINVVYHVDVLSGACLAEVKITRDGGGGTLYQYAGNAATTLPISSGSYMGVVSSVSSVATRALAGFASGGALGAVASGATGILNAQGTNVVHSGGFSGNAGAMGCKKPYLIIERPQTETADNTAKLLGYGSNLFVQLKACKGLTRVKGVHVDAIPATKDEKKLIEEKLVDGVIIS